MKYIVILSLLLIVLAQQSIGKQIGYFNSEECPEGWQEYVQARGRIFVSKGETFQEIEKTGGSSQKKIEVSNIPPHDHYGFTSSHYSDTVNSFLNAQTYASSFGTVKQPGHFMRATNNEYIIQGTTRSPNIGRGSKTGGGVPMDIMNPYIVLLACQKINEDSELYATKAEQNEINGQYANLSERIDKKSEDQLKEINQQKSQVSLVEEKIKELKAKIEESQEGNLKEILENQEEMIKLMNKLMDEQKRSIFYRIEEIEKKQIEPAQRQLEELNVLQRSVEEKQVVLEQEQTVIKKEFDSDYVVGQHQDLQNQIYVIYGLIGGFVLLVVVIFACFVRRVLDSKRGGDCKSDDQSDIPQEKNENCISIQQRNINNK